MGRAKKPKSDRMMQLFTDDKVTALTVYDDLLRGEIGGYRVYLHADGWMNCTCIGFHYRIQKGAFICKHLKALMFLETENKIEVKQSMPKMATTMESFNRFCEGGLPIGDVTLLSGEAARGKTLLALELLVCYLAQNPEQNVLLILTEEKMRNTLNITLARYEEKYGLKNIKRALWTITGKEEYMGKDKKKLKEFKVDTKLEPELVKGNKRETQRLITAFIPNVYDLMCVLGTPGVFISAPGDEKGYQRWVDLPGEFFVYHVNKSVLGKFVEQYNIGMIVIDSITYPVKRKWIRAPSNFPERGACYSKMLGSLMEMCSTYDITAICTGHAIPKGAQPYTSALSPDNTVWGGNAVLHTFKYAIKLAKMVKKVAHKEVKNHNSKRRLYLARWATKENYAPDDKGVPQYIVLQITDNGWIDPVHKTLVKEKKSNAVEKKPTTAKKLKRKKRS